MNTIKEFGTKFKKIKEMEWIKSISHDTSSVGLTFEKLLGKKIDQSSKPDFYDIEIKCKLKDAYHNQFITLFNANPDNQPGEPERIRKLYGYPDKDYKQFKVFNISIYGNYKMHLSNHLFFNININYKEEMIYLNIIDKQHLNTDTQTSWSFSLLKEKIEQKIKLLAFIEVEKKKHLNTNYYKYNKATIYKFKDFGAFLKLIEENKIRITFKVGIRKNKDRLGTSYNHGIGFDLRIDSIEELFQKIEIFT